MEGLNVDIKLATLDEIQKYQAEVLEKMKASKKLKDYLKSNDMTFDDVQDNVPMFQMMLNSLALCEKCKGLNECKQKHTGYVDAVSKEDGVCDIVLVACKHKQEKKRHDEYLKSYVYTDFEDEMLDLTLDNLDLKGADKQYLAAWNAIVKYATNFEKQKKGIYLYGSMGVGKTWLMIALCNTIVSQGKTVAFVNTSKFLSGISQTIKPEVMESLVNADFLVLDDIGQESVTSFNRDEFIYSLLESRTIRHKATCFTSNYSMSDLKEHFSHSMYGDKEEMRAARVIERVRALSLEVELNGESRR